MADESWSWFDNLRDAHARHTPAPPPPPPLQRGDAVELAIGSVVQLKSGGPPMTVAMLSEDEPAARCLWFAENALCEAVLPVGALMPATKEASDG